MDVADGVIIFTCLEICRLPYFGHFLAIETIWFSNKYFIMAKLFDLFLEQLSRFWDFIGPWFMMFWTCWQRGSIHKYDVGGLLQWQKEEIHRLEGISNGNEVLNKKQCKHLLTKLKEVQVCVREMITSSSEVQVFGVALEELCYITHKLGIVVSECGNRNRSQAIAFQINNKEVFRELMFDLRCCWDVIYEMHSTNHARLHPSIIDLDMPTLKDIEDDEEVLQESLKDGRNFEWREYLRQRLGDLQLEGGELDGVEVPIVIDPLKPKLLKQIGKGSYGVVYESIWLGFKCATKILRTLDGIQNFRKEVGILASLSHPNLIKFIYCGVGGSIDELCCHKCIGGNDKSLENLYLVMEFMDMNLSGMLKKQSKPLPYLLAIDIMHQIASGMCYLHDMHVAHLDLKPDHVLMRPNSIEGGKLKSSRFLVKLANYGTSNIEVPNKVLKKQRCHRVGTLGYMAPEIIDQKLESHASIFQADVWSFAMTCSEILSQTAPFGSLPVKTKGILEKHKEFERPKLPMNCEELTRLIEECWVHDPLRRPTFPKICEKLIDLKKMFLRGTYSASLRPKFEKDGASLQKKSRIEKAKEVEEKHVIKVQTILVFKNLIIDCHFY
jgi:serine/threonine protein kinase